MALTDCRMSRFPQKNMASLESYERALTLLNGYFVDPLEEIEGTLAEDPAFVMGHCLRGGMMAVAAERAAEPMLRESVEAAEKLVSVANERERGHITALRFWLDGDFESATDTWGNVVEDYPRDLLALQLAHLGDFYLGRSNMLRDRIGAARPGWDAAVPGYGYVLGMHAFGLEEMNDFAAAEETGREAVSHEPRDPWAIHAVAHVLEMQGRTADGISWFNARRDDWAPDNMFAFHNWWHLALYHLDREEHDRVLEIYDTGVRPEPSDVALEMLDASALLWRLHLDGVDVGDRWDGLADTWEGTIDDGYYAFNDVHAMMAFVGAGRDKAAEALLKTMEKAAGETGTNGMMTRDVGLPLARAIRAFGDGDYAAATDLVEPVAPIAARFGGSNASAMWFSVPWWRALFGPGVGRWHSDSWTCGSRPSPTACLTGATSSAHALCRFVSGVSPAEKVAHSPLYDARAMAYRARYECATSQNLDVHRDPRRHHGARADVDADRPADTAGAAGSFRRARGDGPVRPVAGAVLDRVLDPLLRSGVGPLRAAAGARRGPGDFPDGQRDRGTGTDHRTGDFRADRPGGRRCCGHGAEPRDHP